MLVRVTLGPDYLRWARAAALAFQMIYQQPVRYEYHQIAPLVLLVVGADDHVVPLGQYAKFLAELVPFLATELICCPAGLSSTPSAFTEVAMAI